RIGVRPNEGTMDVGLSLWLPGTELAVVRGVRPQHQMTDSDLAVAGVRYVRLEPMAHWRLTCDAEAIVVDVEAKRAPRPAHVVMDVEFRALTPAVGSDGQGRSGAGASAETRQHVGKGHLEQAGRWSGWIDVDGARHELTRARGNRSTATGGRSAARAWPAGPSRAARASVSRSTSTSWMRTAVRSCRSSDGSRVRFTYRIRYAILTWGRHRHAPTQRREADHLP